MEAMIQHEGKQASIRLVGRFDIHSNVAFRNATKPLLNDSAVGALVVDFSDVSYIDSSALGLLLLLREQAQTTSKHVILKNCGPDLQRVLSVAQFHRIFRIE